MIFQQITRHKYFFPVTLVLGILLLTIAGTNTYNDLMAEKNKLWEKAKQTHTLVGYQNYIKVEPNADYQKKARGQVIAIQQDQLDYSNALNAQTEAAVEQYLDTCQDCSNKKSALKKINKAKRIQEDFDFHLKVKNLSQGKKGFALHDIAQLKNLFPLDENIALWRIQVGEEFQKLSEKHLENKRIVLAQQYAIKADTVHPSPASKALVATIAKNISEAELKKAEAELAKEKEKEEAALKKTTEEKIKAEAARKLAKEKEALKKTALDLNAQLNLLEKCDEKESCTTSFSKEKLAEYQKLKKDFEKNIKNKQLTIPQPSSAQQNLEALEASFPKVLQITQWRNTISDTFLELAKSSPSKALLYLNKSLTFSPEHKSTLTYQKKLSDALSIKEKYALAKKIQTISAMKTFLAQCDETCEYNKEVKLSLNSATKTVANFKRHLASDNLSKGTDGSALDDLYSLTKLFPQDPKIENFKQQINQRFVDLTRNTLKKKNYSLSQKYLTAGLVVAPKNTDLLSLSKQLQKASPTYNAYTKNAKLIPRMVYIPTGNFTMGGKLSYAKPAHKVQVKAFKMSQTEITFSNFLKFARAKRVRINSSGWGTGNRPVINISFRQAKAYTQWLSKKTGRKFRLPSEAQWEYAAHRSNALISAQKINIYALCKYGNGADRNTTFPWRNTKCKDGTGTRTAPVKSYKANTMGLYDMHGNAWEWTLDCWHNNFKGAPTNSSAWTKRGDCSRKVIKGGGWNSSPTSMLPSNRDSALQHIGYNYIGFRIVEIL